MDNTKFSISTKVDEETYREFTEIARKLNISKSALLRILIKHFHVAYRFIGEKHSDLNKLYTRLVEAGLKKDEAIYWLMNNLYDYGTSLRNILVELLKFLRSDEIKLSLIDMDWLKDREGIWFHFVPTDFSKYIFNDMMFQIQKDWDGYAVYSMYLDEEEYRRELPNIVAKLKKAINKLDEENWIEDVEDELMDCADHAEIYLDIDYDKGLGSADLYLSIYVSEWECMPTIDRVNDMFREILEKANVLDIILNKK